jgi:hypothetical protein
MRTKGLVRRLAVSVAAIVAMTGGVVAVTAAQAQAATCRTVELGNNGGAIRPSMSVPVCYNGSRIWVNGGITPRVSGYGYWFGSFDWYGSYNDGSQSWLGVGENFSATLFAPVITLYCTPRWYINAWGNVYSYSRNC